MAKYYPPAGRNSIQASRIKIGKEGIEFDNPREDLEVLANAGIISRTPTSGPDEVKEVEEEKVNPEREVETANTVVEGDTDTSDVVEEQTPLDAPEHPETEEVKPDQMTPIDKPTEAVVEEESNLTAEPKYTQEELDDLHHTKVRALATEEGLEFADTADAKVKLLNLTKTTD